MSTRKESRIILSFVACAPGGMKLLFPKMDIHSRDRHTESDFDIFKSDRDGQVFRLWAVPLKTVRNTGVPNFCNVRGGGQGSISLGTLRYVVSS